MSFQEKKYMNQDSVDKLIELTKESIDDVMDAVDNKADKSSTVSGVTYNTVTSNIQQTIDGSTSNVIGIDVTPTKNSLNLVTSGGVKNALDNVEPTEMTAAQVQTIWDSVPGGGSGGDSMPYTNHNSGFRGKNLGSTFTAEQKAAIADGSFNDLYVGDYWTFGGTVWRIVDIDIFYQHGDPRCTEHHVVIMPDEALFSSSWSDTKYGNTDIATTKLPAEAATLEAIIGTYLLDKEYQVYKDTTSYYQWVKYKMIVPSFHNFFGQYDLDHTATFPSNQPNQFALFRYRPDFINSQPSVNFWGIDVYSSYNVRITHTRVCDWKPSSDSYGIRPYALLAGVDQSQE